MPPAPHPVDVVDIGIDRRLFHPRTSMRSRSMLGLDKKASLVLFAGNLIPQKGAELLIEAAAVLKDEKKVHFVLLGTGPQKEALVEKARQMNVDDVVRFVGSVKREDMPFWYSSADVFAMPSSREAFGLAGLEAMACGTPVIMGEEGGAVEYVDEDINGHLVCTDHSRELIAKLRLLLGDEEKRRSMGRQGLVKAARFDAEGKTKTMLDIYREALFRHSTTNNRPAMIQPNTATLNGTKNKGTSS